MKTKTKPVCKVDANGNKFWYLNGELHREDGPACEYANGNKFWYLNGKYHREDGPACEWADGAKYWYLNGKELTEDEFNKTIKTKPAKAKPAKESPLEENYWVIDTDSAGALSGEFSSRGPYPSQEAAEIAIIECTKELWEDSCACLQSDKRTDWCNPLHIVKVIRTVQPKITANVKLETV